MLLQCFCSSVIWCHSARLLKDVVLLSATKLQCYIAAVLFYLSAFLLHCYIAALIRSCSVVVIVVVFDCLNWCISASVYEVSYIHTEPLLEVLADLKLKMSRFKEKDFVKNAF